MHSHMRNLEQKMTASEHPVITDDTIPLELKVILFKWA